jgi:hypothetical protein
MTVDCLRAGNDKVAAIVNRLCKFLVIALSRTQDTFLVLVVLDAPKALKSPRQRLPQVLQEQFCSLDKRECILIVRAVSREVGDGGHHGCEWEIPG